jgi:charged multivesicular body protein 3
MSQIIDYVLGRLSPEEQVKKWKQNTRAQIRTLDKTLSSIETQQQKAKLQIKQAAKRGDKESCKILAREIVRSNKACNQIHTNKAQLNSVVMGMQQQLGTYFLFQL